MLTAALLYSRITQNRSVRYQSVLAIVLVLCSLLGYLALNSYAAAIAIEFFRGIANMVAILSLYLLAASACPKRSEVSVMAILVALRNIGTNASTYVGGQLFTYVLPGQYFQLVLVSALVPAFSLLLLALLPSRSQIEVDQ